MTGIIVTWRICREMSYCSLVMPPINGTVYDASANGIALLPGRNIMGSKLFHPNECLMWRIGHLLSCDFDRQTNGKIRRKTVLSRSTSYTSVSRPRISLASDYSILSIFISVVLFAFKSARSIQLMMMTDSVYVIGHETSSLLIGTQHKVC